MNSIQLYLSSHPWLKGSLVVIESAVTGGLVDALTSRFDFTHTCNGAIII
jgi:hypothetical protein